MTNPLTGPNLETMTCIPMAVFNGAGWNASTYTALNLSARRGSPTPPVDGFKYDIKILKIYNDSNQGVTLSYDGVTAHDYLPSKGTMIIDLQTNHRNYGPAGGTLYGRQGNIVYGKGTPGTDGLNIYISGYR